MSGFHPFFTLMDDDNLLEQVHTKVKPMATNIKDPLNHGASKHPLIL
jgi:hypothetical protein